MILKACIYPQTSGQRFKKDQYSKATYEHDCKYGHSKLVTVQMMCFENYNNNKDDILTVVVYIKVATTIKRDVPFVFHVE